MVLIAVNYENDEDRIFLKVAEGATIRIGRKPENPPEESGATELLQIAWGDRLVSRNHSLAQREGRDLRIERLPALPGRSTPNLFYTNVAKPLREVLEEPVVLKPGGSLVIGAKGETALFWLESSKDLAAAIQEYRVGLEVKKESFTPAPVESQDYDEVDQLDVYSLRFQLKLLQRELPAQVLSGWTNRRELFERTAAFIENALPGQKGVTAAFIAVDRNRDGVIQFERLHPDARDRADFRPSRTLLKDLDTENPRPSDVHLWDCQDSKVSGSESLGDKIDWVATVPIAPMDQNAQVHHDRELNRPVYLYVEVRQSTENSAMVFLPFLRLIAALIASLLSARDQQRIQDRMATYFSPGLREMMKESNEETLRPTMADCTVMFADRRGSSHVLENARTDQEILERLKENQEIVGKITELVFATDGVITDFAGDGALSLWGWPDTEEISDPLSHALQAVKSAEAIARDLACWGRFEAEHKRFMAPIRLGVSTGRIAVGKTGPEQQWHISVFGGVANLGARLERIAKEFKVPVLISDETYQRVKDMAEWRFRKLCLITPSGFSSCYPIYELILPREWGGSGVEPENVAAYEAALAHFLNREWDAAIDLLETIPRDDPPATWLRDRAEIFRIRPPGEGWQGEIASLSK